MRDGDLSHKPAPILLFDFEGLIGVPKNRLVAKGLDAVNSFIGVGLPISSYYKLNPKAMISMEELFYNFDVTLQVVAFKPPTFLPEIEDFVADIPVNKVYCVSCMDDLTQILNSIRIVSYYYQNPEHYSMRHAPKCSRIDNWDEISL